MVRYPSVRRGSAGLAGAVVGLLTFPQSMPAQQVVGFDPAGEYEVEASFGTTSVDALLVIVPDAGWFSARFTLPGQPTLTVGTVRVGEQTITLSDRIAAAEVTFVLRFETDSAFTGTWAIGPDSGTLTGRRGSERAFLPPPPRCADGPGDLPTPALSPQLTPDPDAARIITSDAALFWKVVDSGPPETLAERLHCDYLRRGTDGVRDLIPGRIVSGESLARTVVAQRDRYEAARQSSLTLAEIEPEIRTVFHRMKALFPDAVFPDVFFVIGRLNTGGTVSQRGLLIGAEMYPDHSAVPAIVAHELVHYQQRPIPGHRRTLLAQSIMEGSADFVAELISGDHINHRAHEYGLPREGALWEEFSQVMHGSDFAGWLYGGAPEGRPEDLGYFFGYRIAQAYYVNAGADEQAIREILDVSDYVDFLDRSGYDPAGR